VESSQVLGALVTVGEGGAAQVALEDDRLKAQIETAAVKVSLSLRIF
jgi:hypothetical protein